MDVRDLAVKPCYETSALMRQYDVITELIMAMEWLGWEPYQADHEDSNGQYEINWTFDNALVTADRQMMYKFMVRSIAEKHGLRATFMPKPFAQLTGNGCHVHVSLHDSNEANVFIPPTNAEAEYVSLSPTGTAFLGGILKNAQAICAITNPLVNSYKRIMASPTSSGSTWAPDTVTYGGNNRTHLVRIPGAPRLEIRIADAAAHPFLLPAALMASGVDGLNNKCDPGPRHDVNMYDPTCPSVTEIRKQAPRLPQNLLDALRALEMDDKNTRELRRLLDPSEDCLRAYAKLKHAEWASYAAHLSSWEHSEYLDC